MFFRMKNDSFESYGKINILCDTNFDYEIFEKELNKVKNIIKIELLEVQKIRMNYSKMKTKIVFYFEMISKESSFYVFKRILKNTFKYMKNKSKSGDYANPISINICLDEYSFKNREISSMNLFGEFENQHFGMEDYDIKVLENNTLELNQSNLEKFKTANITYIDFNSLREVFKLPLEKYKYLNNLARFKKYFEDNLSSGIDEESIEETSSGFFVAKLTSPDNIFNLDVFIETLKKSIKGGPFSEPFFDLTEMIEVLNIIPYEVLVDFAEQNPQELYSFDQFSDCFTDNRKLNWEL